MEQVRQRNLGDVSDEHEQENSDSVHVQHEDGLPAIDSDPSMGAHDTANSGSTREVLHASDADTEESKFDAQLFCRRTIAKSFHEYRKHLASARGVRKAHEDLCLSLAAHIGDGISVVLNEDDSDGDPCEAGTVGDADGQDGKTRLFSMLGMHHMDVPTPPAISDSFTHETTQAATTDHHSNSRGGPTRFNEQPSDNEAILAGDEAQKMLEYAASEMSLSINTRVWVGACKLRDRPWTWALHRASEATLCDYLHAGIAVTSLFNSGAARTYDALTSMFGMVPVDLCVSPRLFSASHLVQLYGVGMRELARDFDITPYTATVKMGLPPQELVTLGVTWRMLTSWPRGRARATSGTPGPISRSTFMAAVQNHPGTYTVDAWKIAFGLSYRELGAIGVTARDAWDLWGHEYRKPARMYEHLGLRNYKNCDSPAFVAKMPKRARTTHAGTHDAARPRAQRHDAPIHTAEEQDQMPGLLNIFSTLFGADGDEDDIDSGQAHARGRRGGPPKQLRRRRVNNRR